jgi:hypothetical protein
MKTYFESALILACLSVGTFHAYAQAGFTFDFDENGNGSLDLRDGSGFQPDPGFLASDPTQAANPLVLTYSLVGVGPVVNGDMRIWEDSARTILSDVMRFTDAAGNLTGQTADRLIFYSDSEPGATPHDLADTGIPATLMPNDGGGILEVGPEGENGFQWAPGGLLDNVYNGISDVPETGGWWSLWAFATTTWILVRWRNKQR